MKDISCSRVGCGPKCCRKCPTEEEDGLRYLVWEINTSRDFRKVICITSVLIRSHVAREARTKKSSDNDTLDKILL